MFSDEKPRIRREKVGKIDRNNFLIFFFCFHIPFDFINWINLIVLVDRNQPNESRYQQGPKMVAHLIEKEKIIVLNQRI